ncbi:MAG: Rnase Y domain-containing protein, partial [Gemmatimonadota bacterium]|nr:Rnase Y domain-containing protein [Gemmatimonadota bacterium]
MDFDFQTAALSWVLGLAIGAAIAWALGRRRARRERERLEEDGRGIVAAARKEAASVRKTAELEGREEAQRLREEWAGEAERRRADLEVLEKRATERSETLDRKLEEFDRRQERLEG